jgi:hypothetical protein
MSRSCSDPCDGLLPWEVPGENTCGADLVIPWAPSCSPMRLVPLESATSVFGEYRNVLGANELDRSELMLGEKLRGLGAVGPWLNDGPGGLNEGRDGAIENGLPEPNDGLGGIEGAGLAGLNT